MAEQVLIEFVADTSKLQPGVDQLEKMGKVEKSQAENFKATNTELQKQVTALNAVNASAAKIGQTGVPLKRTLIDINNQVKGLSVTFMKDFQQGANDALKEAGVSAQEFEEALNKVTGETSSLKTQLREMVAALSEMKIAGQENTEQYRELAEKAGHLKDAIADANQEVSNFASDTSNIDGLLSLTSGLAGGFAVVRGAEALFGDESKELQQTLVSVNATMAILQGFQQIQIVLQKESAASTFLNTAAQTAYNFVVGTSIGLMKAFRIALAATGIGAIVLIIYELVQALQKSNKELEHANELIEVQTKSLEAYAKGVEEATTKEQARVEAAGAAQSEIIRLQGQSLIIQRKALEQSNEDLSKQRDSLKSTSAAWFALNDAISANNEKIGQINNDLLIKSIQLQKQSAVEAKQAVVDLSQAQADAAKKNSSADFAAQRRLAKATSDLEVLNAGENSEKIIAIHAALNKKIAEINRAQRDQEQKEILADMETQLILAQNKSREINDKNTQEEISLQKKIILAKASFDAQAEGLSQKQRLEIIAKGDQDALELQRNYNRQLTRDAAEEQVSRNKSELNKLNINEADKLALIIDNLSLQADLEIQANQGNSSKIKEINRQLDADIRAARLSSIQSTLEYEINLERIKNAESVRMLEKSLSDQDKLRGTSNKYQENLLAKQLGIRRQSLQEQLETVDELTGAELSENFKRTAALNEELQKKLISQKDYNLQYDQLIDDQTKIVEDAEKKKTDITIAESEKRKQRTLQDIQIGLDAATQVVTTLDQLFQLQSAKENQALDDRKQQLKDLQEAGAITEKEATVRQKRIDADERRIRQQQAQREKTIAVFNAALAVPQAVLKGLETGGPILAAVYGAIAAVQLAIVASRPVPKFGKGKKGSYEGLAEVGETGAELIESNGKMFIADRAQTIWLGSKDKVYNPQETINMLSHTSLSTEKVLEPVVKNNGLSIDYEAMGKAVGKHVQTNVFVDGVQEQAKRKQEYEVWLTKRRSF